MIQLSSLQTEYVRQRQYLNKVYIELQWCNATITYLIILKHIRIGSNETP